MITQTRQETEKQSGFTWNWQIATWIAGAIIGLLGLLFLYLAQPQPQVKLGPGPDYSYLPDLNAVASIERKGFGPLNPGASRQTVTPGATLRVTLFSYRPLTLQLEVAEGHGPLKIQANGKEIGELLATDITGRHEFVFTPHLVSSARPEIVFRFDSETSFQLTNLSLDLREQWQPILNSEGDFLLNATALLFVLVLLTGGLARIYALNWLGGVTLGLAGGAGAASIARLLLLVEIGPGGEANSPVYWGWLGCMLFLMTFSLSFAFAGVPIVKDYSLITWARRKLPAFWTAVISLTFFNTLLTVLFFGPVALQNNSFDNLARFWDGPEYLVIAHSLYDPADPILKISEFAQKSPIYWTAHFPLYPFLVRLLAEGVGYLPALFLINFLFGTGFAIALYRFLADFGYSRHPLWLAGLGLFLPLRWLIYHSLGASEAAALFFLVMALYQFKRGNYVQAGLWGAGMVLIRPNGIFLYAGFGLVLTWGAWQESRKIPFLTLKNLLPRLIKFFNWRAALSLSTMPLALAAVFSLYAWRYGDFFAYLNVPENVKHIYPVPLLSLDVTIGRSEGDFYYYILQAAGLVLLWRERRFELFWIGLVLALPTVFLLHDDVLRYSLPAFPVVLLIPFSKILESKAAHWLALPTLLGVLIYSWSQLSLNLVSLPTWQAMLPFLQK